MSPEKQRIAIAQACGFTSVALRLEHGRSDVWGTPDGSGQIQSRVPNYPADLNAMHEAEKVLTDAQYADYANRLSEAAYRLAHGLPHVVITRNTVSPTAAQRAEAFLKTLNLWEEANQEGSAK